MAKLKTNHDKNETGGGTIVKVGLFAAIIGGLFWVFNQFGGSEEVEENYDRPVLVDRIPEGSGPGEPGKPGEPQVADYFLPTSTTGQVIKHAYYALSYSEEHEQAEWVAYELLKEKQYPPYVDRTDNFRPDPKVRKASASPRDYRGSGYDRGHLVPAGDMNFDERAMSETFYMSNMSPQIRNFNGGVWRELEENTRRWAKKFNHLYVVSGPVLSEGVRDQIGLNKVSVPDKYYKIILDITEPELKGIAFLIPNELSNEPLQSYATSIDRIEAITGIDFFPNLLNDDTEELLESQFDVTLWPLDRKKYEKRVEEWNKYR